MAEDIPTYYINLERSPERNRTMCSMYPYATRVEAYDGKTLESYDDIILPKTSSSSSYEFACSLSHIKAIHTAYTNGDTHAIILEDDIHDTHKENWIQSLDTIISHSPPDSDCIVFVCLNARELVNMINMNVMFSKWNQSRWSTGAYYITRNGMEKILHKFMNDGKYTLDVPDMSRHCADNDVIYTPMNTYSYTRPTFIPECKDSMIHSSHVDTIHRSALNVMLQYFDFIKKHAETT